MNKLLFTAIIMLFSILSVSAETQIIGLVGNKTDNTPISNANILIKDTDGKLLAFGISDIDGRFTIKLPDDNDCLSIIVTKIGYKPYSAALSLDNQLAIILMEEGAKELQEVEVKADRIRENGDTVTYTVSSFAEKEDKSIGDVLRRMPGIDVAKNGKIQYQGVDINKFYIEGSDLLGGKYGIATNEISHDDIGAVEILENHQPMQVLRGLSFSDQAAINLKMKSKSKASLLVHGSMAGGFAERLEETLWQGDIFSMMITGKYQMINTFQGNNVGRNLSDQLIDFTYRKTEDMLNGYISLNTPATPNLSQNRSFFNRSWIASSNHLIKSAKGRESKLQIDYINDQASVQSTSTTTYFIESGDKIIIEDKNSLSHRQGLTGKHTYVVNEKTYFLNNTLSTDLSWNNSDMSTIGTMPNSQSARMPDYSVNNTLKLIKRISGNRLITFTSHNEWKSLTEKLSIDNGAQHYGQQVKQSSFYTDEKASLGFILGKMLLSLDTGVSGYLRNLNTNLYGINMADLIGVEALSTDYLRVFASSKFEWRFKWLELTFDFPVNLYTYFFSGSINNRKYLFLSPSLSTRLQLRPRMSLTLQGNVHRSPASLHNIHDSSILTDYRSFCQGVDDYDTSLGQSLSASFSYRNAINGLFVMATGSYSWNKAKFGTVQDIIDDYIFYSYQSHPSNSRNAMVLINISKTLDFMRGAIGIKEIYSRKENRMLSQGLYTEYSNQYFSLSPFINGNISTCLNWNFQFNWERSLLNISDMPQRNFNNYIYAGALTFIPCPLITWTTSGELYHTQNKENNLKKIFMLDTKLTFNISKHIEITTSVTNILNRKEYRYTSFGSLLQYERSIKLRGREFMVSTYISL